MYVAASGLMYVLPYVVLNTGADFRYLWWMIVAALLSAFLVAMPAAEARHARG
jgi:hypothetical protein